MSYGSSSRGQTSTPRAQAGQARIAGLFGFGFLLLAAVCFWLLMRPYEGITQDARLYVGHVLAVLDPKGIGQDMMFGQEGQFGFTLFSAPLSFMLRTFGVSLGAELTSLLALLLWFAGLGALALAVARGRARWVILVFVAALPAIYGGYDIFSYGEALAIPRPFAEAGVLFCFALLADGRKMLALLPLLIGFLLHPLMALPGLGVWAWLVLFDPSERVVPLRIGVAFALVAIAMLCAAAGLGLPMAGRLFQRIDPAWWSILKLRSPYLFPSAWLVSDWARFAVQAATVAIAIRLCEGRVRALFIGVAVVALGGVLVSVLLGDVARSLLIVQLQLWRSTWMLSVFAAIGLALCTLRLWHGSAAEKLALAALCFAWIEMAVVGAVVVALVGALFLIWHPRGRALEVSAQLVIGAWVLVGVAAVLSVGIDLYVLAKIRQDQVAGAIGLLLLVRAMHLAAIPACVLAVLWANSRADDVRVFAAVAVMTLLLALSAWRFWDDRLALTKAIDAGAAPGLKAMLASRPGAVLWLGQPFGVWRLTGRPSWVSKMQGAAIVFSRPLAMAWERRFERLIASGMLGRNFPALSRVHGGLASLEHVSRAGLVHLCEAPDAPAWVIVPKAVIKGVDLSAPRWDLHLWRAPGLLPRLSLAGQHAAWQGSGRFALIACAAGKSTGD